MEFLNHFFGNFSFKKPHLSLQNTIGQRIRALLNVFNIIIHDIHRKNDKNCIKTLKVEKFWNFCHFFGNFSFKKPHLYLQKMHENGENWESFEFLSFSGSFLVHYGVISVIPKKVQKSLQIHIAWN